MKRRICGKGAAAFLAVSSWFVIAATAAEPERADVVVTNTARTNAPSAAAQAVTNPPTAEAGQPVGLKLPPDLAEVVRLKEAGMGDEVIVAFIQKSPPMQPLTADRIIYLKELGISPVCSRLWWSISGSLSKARLHPSTLLQAAVGPGVDAAAIRAE